MRILILGAGAVGGYLGARLIEAGADITFLLREMRLNSIRKDGLIIKSELGDVSLKPKYITSERLKPNYDLVLITCKAYSLINAANDIKPAIGKETLILPILNGVSHLQYLDDFFGRDKVMGGLVHLAVEMNAQGAIEHLNNFHRLIFGIRHPGQAAHGRLFNDILSKSQFDFRLSTHIQHDMWEKFIFLTSLAGATCLFRGNVGEIMKSERGRDFILGIFQECVDIATSFGNAPNKNTILEYIELLTEAESVYTSSMLRDIKSGIATEANHILGEMLKRGIEKNSPTTLLGYAYSHLQVYESQRMQMN